MVTNEFPGGLEQGGADINFYTIGDAQFFLGVVALLNSLRLTGHRHQVVVLDCGFTRDQRDLLSGHCFLVDGIRDRVKNPTQYKPFPYLLRPKGVVVIIDSDIIVTRPLDPLLALAHQGKICAFPDPERNRWFAEWKQLFSLRREPRRQPYVNAGFVAWSTIHWPDMLEHWWQSCERLFEYPTIAEGAPNAEPSAQADQDALNALLMSEMPAEALALQPSEEEAFRPDFRRVRVLDARKLACSHRGHTVALLHSNSSPKPWSTRAWRRVRWRNAHMRLLRRLLSGCDVQIRVSPSQLPIWLRQGHLQQAMTVGLYALNVLISGILLPRKLARVALASLEKSPP